MWFTTEVISPRIVKSFLCAVILQECYISFLFLILRGLSWNPFGAVLDWLFYLIHWKSLFYRIVLCLTTVIFGLLNLQYYSVQKHVSTTRFQKICRAITPSCLQHFLATFALGGIASFSCSGLFHSFDSERLSLLRNCLQIENEFQQFFVVMHGCFCGFMFSLKYFICCLYLLKFSLDKKTKLQILKSEFFETLKDSVSCVLKSLFWYYLLFFIASLFLPRYLLAFTGQQKNGMENILYRLLSLKLLFASVVSGVIIFFNWSFYIVLFNTFLVEPYCFNIDMPTKSKNNKCLATAMQSAETDILKYLAVLDLRLLAQHHLVRRVQIFAISQPGGHPYQWNAISEECMSSLQNLLRNLHTYAVDVTRKETKPGYNTKLEQATIKQYSNKSELSCYKKAYYTLQSWPSVTASYFFEELPNSKIKQIFSTSQSLVWMVEALGFLISDSYIEDKYGVCQLMLPKIVCLLLELKQAVEKLPIDPIGIKTHVRDPQDRYEHIHQRNALKTAINSSLSRIAVAFKDDVKGIYLPNEYERYFQRFVVRKNL